MLASLYTVNVYLKNPTFRGPASYKGIFSSLPAEFYDADGDPNNILDVGADNATGIFGDATKFYAPIRLRAYDQTTEPTEILTNELVVWQNDNNVLNGIYVHDDGLKRYFPMMDGFGAPNQLVKTNPAGDGWKPSAVTIDENNVSNNADRINLNGAVDAPGWSVNTIGNVVAHGPGGGAFSAFGFGAPDDADIERVILIHDGSTADVRSLATGTGTVRVLRIVADTSIFSIDSANDIATLDFADLSITRLGKGLRVKAGTNGRINMGNVLVAGTVTVANTSVTANTMISWNRVVSGGTLGQITITRSAGVGYTITSSSATETSTIDVMLTESTKLVVQRTVEVAIGWRFSDERE
jgi:hypothetical protein